MTAVGIFAGRGDVIVAMFLALLVGAWLGWQLHRFKTYVASRRKGSA